MKSKYRHRGRVDDLKPSKERIHQRRRIYDDEHLCIYGDNYLFSKQNGLTPIYRRGTVKLGEYAYKEGK